MAGYGILLLAAWLGSCDGGASSAPPPATVAEISVAGTPGSNGVFDPAPMADAAGNLWMSYSSVQPSSNLPSMNRVRSRIASSSDGGATWADMDTFIGPPEFPLATLHPAQLGGCLAFTEPGMLARRDGIYVSLQCATPGKIILLRCDRTFSSCAYLGDLLAGDEAAQFSQPGQSLQGFAAPELVEAGGIPYLIVTGYEPPPDTYRGCLVFRIADLGAAALERSGRTPALLKRVSGTAGSFNGACGYHPMAGGSGIIYGEYSSTTQKFHLFASRINLP